jgi:hypothetical protein
MRHTLWLVAVGSVVLLQACGGFEPTTELVAGTYQATTFESQVDGEATIDQLEAGASLTITLHVDGTTTGRLFIPEGTEEGNDMDASMVGTWVLTDKAVDFNQDADTFVRDLTFEARSADRLVGERDFGGGSLRVVLERQAAN